MPRTIAYTLLVPALAGLAACASPAPPPPAKSPERLAAERACTRVEISRYSGEGWYYAFKKKIVDQRCVERRLRATQ